jgi:hypothetical protein
MKKTRCIFPPCIAVNQATSSIVATGITTTIKVTNAIARTNNPINAIEMINTMFVLNATIRTLITASLTKKRIITSAINSKQNNEAMHNDQSTLSSTDTLSGRRSQSCSRSSFVLLFLVLLLLKQRSYGNHHVASDDRVLSALPKSGYLYSSMSDDGGRIHCPDKSNTVFAIFSAPTAKKGKCSHK